MTIMMVREGTLAERDRKWELRTSQDMLVWTPRMIAILPK